MPMRRLLIIAAIGLLASCGGAANAPVINKSPYRQIPPERVVTAGDSIYSISWEYGLDFLDIAKWNGLRAPYDLRAGQRIGLRPPAVANPPPPSPPVVATAPRPAPTPSAPATPRPAPPQTPARTPSTAPAATPAPSTASAPAATTTAAVAAAPLPNTPPSAWLWPAKGSVVAKFSRDSGVNGIRIAGTDGSPVVATAAGEVVYVGEGLRGYGKLIILKHTNTYLSAYAHNRNILVGEGDRVAAGQQIAEMGSSGADRTMLHFEIRVHGKPQDPLKYLDA